jgi:phosphatidylserine/phosphatidylglycerophosphate/cardiolipin synthase-like enzyme
MLFGAFLLSSVSAAEKQSLRDLLLQNIDSARSTIDVLVYEILSDDIAVALADARRRSVKVRVVIDEERSLSLSPAEAYLLENRVPIHKVSLHQWKLLHDKFIIFDNFTAATPSYNQRERENREEDDPTKVFTQKKDILRRLSSEFDQVWASSRPLE